MSVHERVDPVTAPSQESVRSRQPRTTRGLRLPRPRLPLWAVVSTARAPLEALRRDAIYRRSLATADAASAALALVAAIAIGGVAGVRPVGALSLPLVVAGAKLLGLYDRDPLVLHKSTLDEAPTLFQLSALYALVTWLLHAELFTGPVGSPQLLVLWGAFLLCVLIGRSAARALAHRLAPPERCLVIGSARARARFKDKIEHVHARVEVVGTLQLENERRSTDDYAGVERRRRALGVADLEMLIAERDVHRVVIFPGRSHPEALTDAMVCVKALGVNVSIMPRMMEVVGSSVELDNFDGITMLGVRRFGVTRSSYLIKRSMDVLVSSAILLLVAPLIALVAIAIKLDSRGPVFYRQTRVGREGRRFTMLKFRSMIDGAHAQRAALAHMSIAEGLFKLERDPRVTRVGRLLRATSLDELPQLINVLRGEMSLVGPRPLVVEEDERVADRHRGRLKLVPGITGPWQILGPARVTLSEMATIDYLYGANWSLWNDVKILLRTIEHVLRFRGL